MILGEPAHITVALRNLANELADPSANTLTLVVIRPDGHEDKYVEGELEDLGVGLFAKNYQTTKVGLHHFKWTASGQTVFEGVFEVESAFAEGTTPDTTDLKVLIPRARRKIEGPWGFPNGRAPLDDGQIYALVADATSEIIMLGGGWFHHKLEVKERDPLGGYPTDWQTDTLLDEYEAAIICSQVALNFYFQMFRLMKVSETVRNEGTEWTYSLSANVIRSYLDDVKDERDKAIAGLRVNLPVIDRYASNIRVRDQATVAILEWWDINSPSLVQGGLPGGQEAAVVPWQPSGEVGIP